MEQPKRCCKHTAKATTTVSFDLLNDIRFSNFFQTVLIRSKVLVVSEEISCLWFYLPLFQHLISFHLAADSAQRHPDVAMTLSGCTVRSLAHSGPASEVQGRSDERTDGKAKAGMYP